MDVRGPLPLVPHAAKAYGLQRPTAAPATSAVSKLAAATVSVPADPALAPSMTPQGAFAMYTRAADRVEVATKVALGSTIDARA